ncbi:5f493113-6eb7-49fd-9771-bfc1267d449f [Sclerotinia trifoliorum]|uniref:5f493113-6eb7-49fd-9771-bfc1267d449f n=1 Tax=Sclerotinia trifoliorum TaxID=28548 RepID=A0A8H2W6Z3_9HELO|nr:5f493113-6eb7-49fd-9771-bfc1267d449f [Sclerotinia trifoliorum]
MDGIMEKVKEVSISNWRSSQLSISSQLFMSHDPTASLIPIPILMHIPTMTKMIPLSLTTTSSTLSFKKYTSSTSSTSSTSTSIRYTTSNYTFLSPNNIIILLTILLSFLVQTCSAEFYIEEQMMEVREDIPELFASTLARLARSGTILVDQQPDPSLPRDSVPDFETWEITHHTGISLGSGMDGEEEKSARENNNSIQNQDNQKTQGNQDTDQIGDLVSTTDEFDSDSDSNLGIDKRNVATITSTATITPPKITGTATATVTDSSSSTLASSGTSSGQLSAATARPSLPTPFDSGFTSNVTSTCSSFMMNFLADDSFKACLPFSLLLQNSNSFFQASKSIVRITQTLDASCSANSQSCSNLMNSIASNITSPNACSTDLTAANPLVTQARLGLLAYSSLYTASCLKDPINGAYCYAQAVTNTSSPTDSYIYYLPVNVSLPGGSQPTCNSCLKNTMAIFEQAGAVRSSAIAGTYEQAAGMINVQCGPGFVNASLPAAAVVTGTATSAVIRSGAIEGIVGLLMFWIMVLGRLI